MRVFISHSSRDVPLVAPLIDLLRSALNIKAGDIRCTSVDGYRLPAGARTEDQLRAEVTEAEAFVGIISAASVESMYVVFELGARWATGKHLIPLLVRSTLSGLLKGPLEGRNALAADSEAQLHQLVQDLAAVLKVVPDPPAAYGKHVGLVLDAVGSAADDQPPGGPSADATIAARQPSGGHWPQARTLPCLQSKLQSLSKTNRKLVLEIAKADRVYAGDLCQVLALERPEVVYRGKELEAQELIAAQDLTDMEYSLHPAIRNLLGERSNRLVCAMLA